MVVMCLSTHVDDTKGCSMEAEAKLSIPHREKHIGGMTQELAGLPTRGLNMSRVRMVLSISTRAHMLLSSDPLMLVALKAGLMRRRLARR